ncbi:cupin domain-containing protein [Paenibacillus flagellatus]|uniref:cupin domain-containing protein n=1 Tax=Paenibacillus flagellatus TaxID=2211139 RepID=UPI001FECD3CD|nr:cupin domain-containing protein [Paenibacillus flagellatus]
MQLSFDMRNAVYFKKNDRNFILQQFAGQQPLQQNLGLLDVYFSRGNSVEAHWHPNANELIYMVQGEAEISVLEPSGLRLLRYRVKPPQTVYIPMGWWHWAFALADQTHLLAIFDNNATEVIFGSDILRKTPPEVFQEIYGVDAAKLAEVLKPIDRTVVMGPPDPTDIRWRIGANGNT